MKGRRRLSRTTLLPNLCASLIVLAMDWHVQYRRGGTDHLVMFPSPETAIENACRLMDDAYDVFGIGTGAPTDSIEREQIAGIYAIWSRAKSPVPVPLYRAGRRPE
jgi:hypothetical protein